MTRSLDLILSITALLVLSPILIFTMILLKFTGEGYIFYKQNRIGLNKNNFQLLKFATMLKDSPNLGTGTITLRNDERILPIGKFLRKTKLNELPQLVNVILGDMSLIGPRPLTDQTFSAYSDAVQVKIVTIRPGLSGIGSIVFRDEENLLTDDEQSEKFYQEVIAAYKGEIEVWFVDNKNLYIYLILILLTVWCIILGTSKNIWRIFPSLPKPPEGLLVLFR
jgi:lipopolysaccharide/colanic/teichoic acid biosynthesis glycosyltransferase